MDMIYEQNACEITLNDQLVFSNSAPVLEPVLLEENSHVCYLQLACLTSTTIPSVTIATVRNYTFTAAISDIHYSAIQVETPAKQQLTPLEVEMPKTVHVMDVISVHPTLPAGLKVNERSGQIEGIPEEVSPMTVYTVTLTTTRGVENATIAIGVSGRNDGLNK